MSRCFFCGEFIKLRETCDHAIRIGHAHNVTTRGHGFIGISA